MSVLERGRQPISRRQFVRTSVGASGLVIMPSRTALGFQANSAVTLGVVGCGGRGSGVAAKMRQHAPCRVIALADVFADRLEEASRRFAADSPRTWQGFDAYEKLLASEVDAVLIASPPYYHPQQFEAAVAAGKHIYLEKPVAVDTAGCLRVLEAGKQVRDRSVMVGFQSRARKDLKEGVRRLREGAIGPVVCGKAYYNSGHLGRRDRPGMSAQEARLRNWVFDRVLSGDILVEQNIHVIDICNWAIGALPVKAYGTGGRKIRTEVGDTWDRYEVLFTYPGDVVVAFTSTQFMNLGWDNAGEAFYGPKGDFEVLGWATDARRVRIRHTEQDVWYYEEHPGDMEVDKFQAFFKGIQANQPVNETTQGVEATLSAILGRTAAYRGREITWDEMLDEREAWEA